MAKWQTSTIVPLSAVTGWILWFDDFRNGRESSRLRVSGFTQKLNGL